MEKKTVITDLCERLDLLRLRYGIVFQTLSPAVPPFIPMAEAISRGLAAEDRAAVQITRALVDPTEMDRAEFWGTPLGRLLFLARGYVSGTCTQTVAAAVLDCSRQWVSAMVAEDKLTAAHDRGVYAEEVHKILKSRIDRLVK
jgi:hypothetical protein